MGTGAQSMGEADLQNRGRWQGQRPLPLDSQVSTGTRIFLFHKRYHSYCGAGEAEDTPL